MAAIRKTTREPARPSIHDPDWGDLSVFLAVAEAGSLSKAAQRLKTTQPTVSKRVDALEKMLGVTLLERNQAGAALTREGEIVARHAATMGRSMRQLVDAVSMRNRAAEGVVTIVCPDALATYMLAPRIAAFQRAFPNLLLDIRGRAEPGEQADLTIQFQESKRMDDVAVALGWQHYAAFAAQDYIDLYQSPASITDAFHHKVLIHTDHEEQTHRWDAKAVALQKVIQPVVRTDLGVFMVKSVCNGSGAAALPTYIARHEPKLMMVSSEEYARVRFWLVFDRDKGFHARVRETINWIKEIFARERNPWFWEEFVQPEDFEAMLDESKLGASAKAARRQAER